MIEVLISKGQIIWFAGVIFVVMAFIFFRNYFTQYWYGTVSVETEDKTIGFVFLVCGLIMIFLGINYEYRLFEVKVT